MSRSHLLLLLLCAAALVAISSCTSPWDGQWSDNGGYGGTQYLCSSSDGSKLYGAWSESGVLVGTFTNNQRNVSGTWYEAGVGPCFSGSFTWSLDASGNSYTGTFSCASQPALVYFVSETRLSSAVPTADQCALLATNANVNGEWVSNAASPLTTDICISGNSYQASYSFAVADYHGTGHGYETGQVFQNGAVASGYSETAAGDGAVSITFRSSSGNLVSFKWSASAPHQHRAKNAPASAHQLVTSTMATTRSHNCGENAYIFAVAYGASERSMPVLGALLVLVSVLVVFAF